ncbi:MAG: hypothetical protein LQ344_008048, partial [Seirophora lacunosa]
MAMTPSSQRHPTVSPTNPPTMGPKTGPQNGAAAKIDIARPRCDAGNMSAITPPEFVRGEDPKAPAKKRKMTSVWTFLDPAAAALKA